MKKIIFCMFVFSTIPVFIIAQGCIPVRNIAGFGQYNLTGNAFTTAPWQLDITNRYFHSFRDFRETTDLKTPEQNESVNNVYTFDMVISRLLNNGWALALNLPVTANTRTSSVEHGGPNTTRHSTHSFGAGDLRFTVYKWLRSPSASQRWNIQAGLGIKFPTGAYNYQDYFYRNDTTAVLSAVNPSIQLGDGGTGIITELNAFYIINKTITLYSNFYYLLSPRNENGTQYTLGKTPTSLQVKADAINNSVPDVYAWHAGAYINFHTISFSAAVRDEGSPVYDLIGKSDGIRRAGHYLSVEPGILFNLKSVTLYAYLPVVVDRRIKQNVPDKRMTDLTGVQTVGPGGSANVVFLAGASFKF